MIFIATALFPMFRRSTIEGFLIHKLYKTIKQQPHHTSSANLKDEIDFAKQTLKKRYKTRHLPLCGLFWNLKKFFIQLFDRIKCCKKIMCFDFTADEKTFMSAKLRLARELDVKNFIRNFRMLKSQLKILLDANHKKLLRMQAGQSVITEFNHDTPSIFFRSVTDLKSSELQNYLFDSSDFTSGDYLSGLDAM
jgi:hypothetical protein